MATMDAEVSISVHEFYHEMTDWEKEEMLELLNDQEGYSSEFLVQVQEFLEWKAFNLRMNQEDDTLLNEISRDIERIYNEARS